MQAPASVQQAFWAALGRECARERRLLLSVYEQHGISPRSAATRTRWDDHWSRRAYNARMREERGTRDNGFDPADAEELKSIEARSYVETLTGEVPNRAGFICCPLPTHEERTPSFHCKGSWWRCYGCGEKGTIYDLAAALWDRKMYGEDFLLLHRELLERFA